MSILLGCKMFAAIGLLKFSAHFVDFVRCLNVLDDLLLVFAEAEEEAGFRPGATLLGTTDPLLDPLLDPLQRM